MCVRARARVCVLAHGVVVDVRVQGTQSIRVELSCGQLELFFLSTCVAIVTE